jgi:hypothetical protein
MTILSCSTKKESKINEIDTTFINKLKREQQYRDFAEKSAFDDDTVLETVKNYIVDSLKRKTSDFLYTISFDSFDDTIYYSVTTYDKKSVVFEPLIKNYEFDSVRSFYIKHSDKFNIKFFGHSSRFTPRLGENIIQARDRSKNKVLLNRIIQDLITDGHNPNDFDMLKIEVTEQDSITGLDLGTYYELTHKSFVRHMSLSYDSGFIYYKIDTLTNSILRKFKND